MDSITQIALGAAVGEAIAGRKAGFRGAMWGAFLGTFPDLDILATPFLDGVGQIRFHRGISHSLFFCFAIAPVFGWIIHTIHKVENTTMWLWIKLAWWVLFTHVFIDLATTYGTQILYPLSRTPFTLDSIFIIDPLYTLPLLAGLLTAFVFRNNPKIRTRANYAGLIASSFYLALALGIKAHVHGTFQQSFTHQYGYYEELKTTPAGPSILLWNGYAIRGDSVFHASYSIFDSSPDLRFTEIPRNSHLIEPFKNDRAIQTLLWFSRGYYTARKEGEDIVFYDLRFGRNDLWLTDKESNFVWKNELLVNNMGEAYDFSTPETETRVSILSLYWNRLWGI